MPKQRDRKVIDEELRMHDEEVAALQAELVPEIEYDDWPEDELDSHDLRELERLSQDINLRLQRLEPALTYTDVVRQRNFNPLPELVPA